MKLTPVQEIPGRTVKKNLQAELDAFEKSDAQIVKVNYDENDYKRISSCYSAFQKAIKLSGYLMGVVQRQGVVYIRKLNKTE